MNDPVMSARLDVIHQLAGSISEHIAVMDREFNVIYSNNGAANRQPVGPKSMTKCYEAFAQRKEPCEICPATQLFHNPPIERFSSSSESERPPCGMQKAFPLLGRDGQVVSMMALCERPARTSSIPDESFSPIVRQHLGDLIGRSPVMQQLFDTIRLVADSSATVLIQGESGTGKELVAKTIHQLSHRCDKPFVVIDCGSLPETLLESELFGHVKGAFTGAFANKRGLFEEAGSGTILLDEIADTSPTFQAKLLRVLQEGEIKRVGSNQFIKVNARVISASNKDLAELVAAKRFRQDLYYRLAVLPLEVPPLRQRREDVALLVEHFIQQSCARHHQPTRRVSPEVLCALMEAPWVGNVRELQHHVERGVVTTSGPDFPAQDAVSSGVQIPPADLRSIRRDAVSQAERARIVAALDAMNGHRVKAAKVLKISRASLYNKIREYRIS